MEVTDDRHMHAGARKLIPNVRHGRGSFIGVDGDAYEFRPSACQRPDLLHRTLDISRIRVRHRLHDNRRSTTDGDRTDANGNRSAARKGSH
jgi:hypothetical protein